ncbi:MAG: phenylacetate--CoA ligase family protein [Pyrinomonadaceae bacterium]
MKYGSGQFRSFYYSLPQPAKNLLASAYGASARRARYGITFHETLRFLRESQHWSNERLNDYQQERLHQFLRNVVKRTPYYRSHDEYPDLLNTDAPLQQFPVINKNHLRGEVADFYHDDFRSMQCHWYHTSGTTGSAIAFPVSHDHFQREHAFRALAYEWGGVSLTGGDKVAICAGHPVAHPDRKVPPYWVYDWTNKWLYLSSSSLTKRNLSDYVNELKRFQPVMLAGYPSSLYLLALGFEKFGGKLNLRSISTSSETLLPRQRAKIENAFGAKVFDYYGQAENCAHIVECEAGERHAKPEYSAIEVLDKNNNPCGPGETGRLVCTGFSNKAFPLIRYDIGDVVTIAKNQVAKCGRGGLLIENILGRIEDYIATPEGRLVGRLDHLFKDSANVVEAQLFQENVDELICRILRTEDYSIEDEQAILEEARLRLGSAIRISFDYVDEIPRSANGKFQFVVSMIDQSKMLHEFAD